MPRPSRLVVVIAALAVAGGWAMPAPAAADSGGADRVPADGVSSSFSPAELEDLATYALLNGRELPDVEEQFTGVSDFIGMVEAAQEKLPDAFVYAEWGRGSGLLVVRPDGYETARDLVVRSGAHSEVLKRDLPAERVQQELVNAVAQSLDESLAKNSDVSYDYGTNRIIVSVESSPSVKNVSISERLMTQASQSGIRIDVVSRDTKISEATARGGMSYGGCTGGFIGKPSSGSTYRGIITAKHCTSRPSSYDGNPTTSSGSSTILGKDLRFTRFASGAYNNTFRYDSGSFRSATSTINPVVGAVACKYGTVTGRFCTTIAKNGVSVDGNTGMSQTVNGSVQPGDSGGPWYYGNSAMGITYGYTYPAGQPTNPTTDLFTGIGTAYIVLTS